MLESCGLPAESHVCLGLQVACLNDICPHRGAPLSLGKVNTVNGHECVVCPYHGWAFDEDGVLRSVPAAEGIGEWPEKALVDHYPVEEKVRVVNGDSQGNQLLVAWKVQRLGGWWPSKQEVRGSGSCGGLLCTRLPLVE